MPFTLKDFLNVFTQYNTAVFPFQIILYVSAIYILFLLYKKRKYSDKLISGILAFYFFWIGIVYHIIFFSGINTLAYAFGGLFILQGILFIKDGITKAKLEFEVFNNIKTYTAFLFISYALIIYPILGYLLGHVYPASPTFGLPCPTVIFTFGILLFANNKMPAYIILIPLLWSFLGISAAINLGIKEDMGLLAAGIIGSSLILLEKARIRRVRIPD